MGNGYDSSGSSAKIFDTPSKFSFVSCSGNENPSAFRGGHVLILGMDGVTRSAQNIFLSNQKYKLQDSHYNERDGSSSEPFREEGDIPLELEILLILSAMGIVGWGFYLYYDRRCFIGILIFGFGVCLLLSLATDTLFCDPLFWRAFSAPGIEAYRCQCSEHSENRYMFQLPNLQSDLVHFGGAFVEQ
jgi:hypothetical protein